MESKKPRQKQPVRKTEAELRRELERLAPSKEQLRRLAEKYPAPQKWYDEDTTSDGADMEKAGPSRSRLRKLQRFPSLRRSWYQQNDNPLQKCLAVASGHSGCLPERDSHGSMASNRRLAAMICAPARSVARNVAVLLMPSLLKRFRHHEAFAANPRNLLSCDHVRRVRVSPAARVAARQAEHRAFIPGLAIDSAPVLPRRSRDRSPSSYGIPTRKACSYSWCSSHRGARSGCRD